MNVIRYEDAQKKFPAEVKGCENLISMLDILRDVAKKFDGKVVNKRLDTAFRNACDNQAYLEFDRMSSTRRIKVSLSTSYIDGVYVDNMYEIIFGDYWNAYKGDVLDYTSLCSEIDRAKVALKQRALDFTDAAVNYRVYRERMLEMDKKYRELYDSLPYALKPARGFIEHPFNQYYE